MRFFACLAHYIHNSRWDHEGAGGLDLLNELGTQFPDPVVDLLTAFF